MNDASGDQKDVYPIGKKNPTLPFYPAVRAGDFIFVSGHCQGAGHRNSANALARADEVIE